MTVAARIVQAQDTAANWTANNPTLLQGEFGLETDTGKVKFAWNGDAAWNTLAYWTGPTGATGATGAAGAPGPAGADGLGVPTGGTTGQVLRKHSNTNNDTEWHSLGSMSEQDASAVNITGGTVTASTGTFGTLVETSDSQFKCAVKPLRRPLRKVMALRPVEFFSIVSKNREIGLIAQDVMGVYPEAVQVDQTLSLSYARLVAPLIGAVQEQQRHIRALWVMIILLLLAFFCAPAHALTAPSIELSGTSVVVSATKPGATISASIGYFRAVSASTANVGLLTSQNVSVTGNVSANQFIGDGSLLTGISGGGGGTSPSWYAIQNIPTQVQAVSSSGSITMAEVSATRLYAANISGTNLGGTLTTAAQNLIQTMTGLTTVSVTGNVSVSTINGQTPVFGNSSISTTTFTTASNISGSTAIGYNANIGTGVDNTAYGVKAGFSFGNNGSASYNTALGASALSSATGDYNTAVGAHAFRGSTVDQNTGQGNTAIGFESLLVNSEGNSNTAIGFQTMWDNQTGSANTAIGYLALTHNIEGDNNTGLGYAALLNNADGNLNVAVGPFSLNSNISGGSNVGVGYQALTLAQADENVGVGTFALTGATGLSSGNTAVGQGALGYLDNGSYNVAIGNSAGAYLEGGSENIFIGHFTEYPISSTMSNQLNIGNTIEGYMGGDNTKLGINVVSATATLEVSGTVSASFFVGDGSQITGITHSSPSWYAVQNIPTPVQAVSNSGSITMAEVSATRLYAANISGSSIAGTLSTAAQANITSVGTLTGLTVSGVGTFGTVTATAVNGLSISGTSIAGKLITAAQPSITTVGTLSGLNVTGTVTATTFSGNVPVTSLNSGTGATSATYWRGDGSWAVPTSNIVTAAYTSSTDITSQILFDGSAPQNTEGVQIASVTITPHSTSSKIKIQFSCWGRISASGAPVATLFRDSGTSAIQVAAGSTFSAAGVSTINMLFVDAPATTSPVTYYLRIGVGGSYTYTINNSGYFPTSSATLVAEEI